jgi:hypothetical protein
LAFNQTNTTGTYVVAVYGFEQASFEITIVHSKIKVIDVFPGNPFTTTISKHEQIYLKFSNYFTEDLTFAMNVDYGFGVILINTVKYGENKQVEMNLPTEDNYDFSSE